jgi:hypothetical protein
MWNSATAWLPTAFLISFIFPNPVLAEVETSLPALSESDTSESPDASATRAPDPGEMQRQFESQEEFEAALRAHIEAERAAAWEKAHPPGRRTAAQMMGAPPGSIRVAPSPPNAQEFRERLESRVDISEVQVNLDGRAETSPGKFKLQGDLIPALVQPMENKEIPTAESVAAAFLNENAALFGIVDVDDLILVSAEIVARGASFVSYHRQVGGVRLSNFSIKFHIDPEGRIERIWGRIPAAPEDLYESVQRPILTEEEAREVATTELLSTGRHIWLTTRLTLILESAPPYLIWEASNDSPGNGGFINSRVKINAATGEVLDRHEVERREFRD